MHCWPCFIPWWYKIHYASHYPSVRMPGNEMIHIQGGYLRLHFNICKQQHVIFTLKSRSEKTKASGIRSSNGCETSVGNPRRRAWPYSHQGWPPLTLIQMHPRLLWFSAGVELSVKIVGGADPRVWMKYTFNKADCPRHSKGKERIARRVRAPVTAAVPRRQCS